MWHTIRRSIVNNARTRPSVALTPRIRAWQPTTTITPTNANIPLGGTKTSHKHDFNVITGGKQPDFRPISLKTTDPTCSEPYAVEVPILEPIPPLDASPNGKAVNISAYYAARAIDLSAIFSENSLYFPNYTRDTQSRSVTITINEDLCQYMIIFKYGSIVFFNIPEELHSTYIKELTSRVKVLPLIDDVVHNDSYTVMVHHDLGLPYELSPLHLKLSDMSFPQVQLVSTAMAHSVALDFYAATVDKMMESFLLANMKIQNSGELGNFLPKQHLFSLIAQNNTITTTVLSNMGIFEGLDAAWDNTDYYETYEAIRREFEIEYRYQDLSMKLDMVKEDSRFFLDMMHNKNSTKLEWIIIVLIAAELGLGLLNLIDKTGGVPPGI